jgi:transcriptional regulator GlxA family with amidase domain
MAEPHRIAVLLLDGVIPFEAGIPAKLFGSVGAAGPDGQPLYQVGACSLDGGPVGTPAGFRLLPDNGIEILTDADTVVLPGISRGRAMTDGTLEPDLAAALATIGPATRVVSICTSAFVLAAAGLLDGLRATTHWRHSDRFAELFPRVRLDPGVLWVDNGRVLTSAGNAAGLDLCLHILRSDHGSDLANRVARYNVLPPWREGGQSQFIERHVPDPTDTSTAATRAWALERLDEPLDLAAMARHASMSVRTFTRRFREETGMSPNQWLVGQRVERVRQLLESTDLAVDKIATQAGFGTTASLRQHLHAKIGVSPQAYRRTFRPVAG